MKCKLTVSSLVASFSLAIFSNNLVQAAPYASKIRVDGTTVTFVLNEPSDALTFSINDGPA